MKKIFFSAAIAALMGVAFIAKPKVNQNKGLSDIQLQNAEVLADTEGGTTLKPPCDNVTGYKNGLLLLLPVFLVKRSLEITVILSEQDMIRLAAFNQFTK